MTEHAGLYVAKVCKYHVCQMAAEGSLLTHGSWPSAGQGGSELQPLYRSAR